MTDTDTAADQHWVPVLCGGCPSGYYRPADKSSADSWECFRPGGREGCGNVVTRPQLDAGATGDVFATHNGVLSRGIPAGTLFRYASPQVQAYGEYAPSLPPQTLTVGQLDRHLHDHCAFSSWDITHTIGSAARDGEYEHVSGYGLRRVITRLP